MINYVAASARMFLNRSQQLLQSHFYSSQEMCVLHNGVQKMISGRFLHNSACKVHLLVEKDDK
jgi:hypothetical protein